MPPADRLRRRLLLAFWHVMNPVVRRLAGVAPWWVVVETTGRRTGRPRETPLAHGPLRDSHLLLIAVHGRHSAWVRNIEAQSAVRVRLRRRWYAGRATVLPYDDETARSFSRYAQLGPRLLGIDPVLVRVDVGEDPRG